MLFLRHFFFALSQQKPPFCTLLLFCVLLPCTASAIDYFNVNNPKFHALRLESSLEPANSIDLLYIQSLIESTLQQTQYFSVKAIQGKRPSAKASFHLHLKLINKNPFSMQISLHSIKRKKVLIQQNISADADEDLKKMTLKLSDQIVEATLGVPGIAFSQIAYTAKFSDLEKQIMRISFDGTQQQRFSYNFASNNLSNWSFDDQHLLYTQFSRSGSQIAIQALDRTQSTIISIPKVKQPLAGSWHPNGKKLLLTLMQGGNTDIYEYHLKNKTLKPVTQWSSLETSGVWSPDGRYIAFVSDHVRHKYPQVYILKYGQRLRSGYEQRITFNGGYNTSPRWSPDSKRLIYTGKYKRHFQIFKYTLATRKHQLLTFGSYDSEHPDWSPNGKQIVFSSKKTGVFKLYYISEHGGTMRRVTTNPASTVETAPAWSKGNPAYLLP